jgi:hypothetical protein
MTSKKIEKVLKQVLIHDGDMDYGLYDFELEELLDDLKSSLARDQDDYIFSVTEHSGHAAMVLIDNSGQVYINEEARERLKVLWPAAYESNMKRFIPLFAKQLNAGELPLNGVKTVR